MQDKLDRVLAELEVRYQLGREFTARVRPVAEKIFDPLTPEESRPGLLTHLAELYERQAQVKRDCRQAQEHFKRLFDEIAGIMARFLGIDPSSPGRDEGQGDDEEKPRGD